MTIDTEVVSGGQELQRQMQRVGDPGDPGVDRSLTTLW